MSGISLFILAWVLSVATCAIACLTVAAPQRSARRVPVLAVNLGRFRSVQDIFCPADTGRDPRRYTRDPPRLASLLDLGREADD